MKIGLFSDLHMSYLGTEISGFDGLSKTLEVFQSKKVGGIIFLGDFFAKRYKIPHRLLYTIVNEIERFEYLEDLDFFYMIPGNHDMFLLSGANSIKFLNLKKNIKVIEEPTVLMIDGINCYFTPYRKKMEKKVLKFLQTPSGKNNILFLHQYIDVEEEKVFNVKEDLIPEKLLSKYDMVFSGHYHTPFVKENKKYKLFNLGSARHIDFGDSEGRNRYIYIWDTKKSDVEAINLGLPKYVKIKISNEKERDLVLTEVRENPKDHYKINVPDKLVTSDLELSPNVQLDKEYEKYEVTSRLSISEECPMGEIVDKYVNAKMEDKDRIAFCIEKGLEIMKEVGINV